VDRRRFLLSSGRLTAAGFAAAALARCAPQPAVSPSAGASGRPSPSGGPASPSVAPSLEPSLEPAPTLGTPRPRDDRIVLENAKRGTLGWILGGPQYPLSCFVAPASPAAGERLTLHVNSDVPFDVEWYRLGWYDGDGGRLVRVDRGLPAQTGGLIEPDPMTGLVEAPWPVALQITVPADWLSGLYTVVIRGGRPGPIARGSRVGYRGGPAAAAPFVVRPVGGTTATPAPVLFVSAATTWQAYNPWGGADFYGASAEDAPEAAAGRRAVAISFDRPYAGDQGCGYQRRWELQFVRWQEREGRDVEYMADVDLELHPDLLNGRRLIVFAGHHEYWSRPMRSTIEGAVASGINVAFLSANEVFWQVRLGPSPLGPARRVTCYKSARLDPFAITNPALTTCRWREPPVNDPEAPLIGQMYGHIVRRPADWVVRSSRHWLYAGTGLRDGDRLSNLVGQEYDSYFPQFAHPGTVLLAQSPVDAVITGTEIYPSPPIHTATMYKADSGATVFAAGTFQWSWALDAYGDRMYAGVKTPVDPRVGIMTRNLFDRLGDGPA